MSSSQVRQLDKKTIQLNLTSVSTIITTTTTTLRGDVKDIKSAIIYASQRCICDWQMPFYVKGLSLTHGNGWIIQSGTYIRCGCLAYTEPWPLDSHLLGRVSNSMQYNKFVPQLAKNVQMVHYEGKGQYY
jgi:hypothetical protein